MNATAPERPLLVVENDASDPVARLGEWMTDAGATLDVRAKGVDELPADLSGFSALVVLGGMQNAYDDDGWLPRVRDLMADALRDEIPTLGICLGGQLLAVVSGGQVGPAPEPEFGPELVAKRQAAAVDPLFRELPITPDVIQWHHDAVTRLPGSAELLASSPVCEVQAFRVGRTAWGTQFHIETTPEIVRRWAAQDGDDAGDLDRIIERSDAVHDDIAEVWRPFAETFVALAADPGSVPRQPRNLLAGRQTTAEPITDPAAIRAALAAEMQAARGTHGH